MNYPPNKQWAGLFKGNYSGSIWKGRNIDLERSAGRVVLSDKGRIHTNDADSNMSNLGIATKFLRSDADATDRFWGVCGNGVTGARLFKTDSASPLATWAEETQGTGDTPPTTALDVEIFETLNGEQQMLAVLPTDIALLNSPATANRWDINWGTTVAAPAIVLTTATLHPIARLQRLIAIGNGNVLQTIDKNSVVTNSRLTMPYGYSIRNIYTSADRFWIGCTNLLGGNARVIEWDGFSLSYNNDYGLVGSIPLTAFIVDNIPYFITNYAHIHKYMGGSFQIVQSFPCAEEQLEIEDGQISTYGASVNRDLAYILLNTSSSAFINSKRQDAGIWIFNTGNKNLYHHAGLGAFKTDSTAPDFGQSPLSAVGGISIIPITSSVQSPIWLAGGKYHTAFDDADIAETGATKFAIFRSTRNDLRATTIGPNRGYFVTPYIPIKDVEAIWEGLWLKFRKFIDSDNRIVVKGRVTEPLELADADLAATSPRFVEKSGVWATTTTFTCKVPTGVVVGNEVEVMSGNGATHCCHITVLSATPDNSTSITVTVDDAIPTLNASGSRGALFRFDNFIKLETITNATIGNKRVVFTASAHGEFAQFKIFLDGFSMEIDELQPILKTLTKASQS